VGQELERRGHRFCRYADDCNIYVRSRRAGERVMTSVSGLIVNISSILGLIPAPFMGVYASTKTLSKGCRNRSPPECTHSASAWS
jgi:hypothetical protein